MDKLVINLSDQILTPDQLSVLSKGLNFCPTPKEPNPGELRTDLDDFHRRLRLNLHFSDPEEDTSPPTPLLLPDNFNSTVEFKHHKFKLKSSFNPTGPPNLETFITINEHDFNFRPVHTEPGYSNLTWGEWKALKELSNMKHLIFKTADKGRATTVQSRDQYLAEGHRQLNDSRFYTKLDHDPNEQYRQDINQFLHTMLEDGEFDISVYDYLIMGKDQIRTPILYLLPKLHKQQVPVPGRPVVSQINSPTSKIAHFVDHFLNPCANTKPSYIKDTTHFLNILENLGPLPDGAWLVTMDVTSLYTCINHDSGIAAARDALYEARPNLHVKPSNTNLLQLLEFVLTKNSFQFNGDMYWQKNGTSMGAKLAPGYSNLFMSKFELDFVYTYHTQPLLWKRYIDDCFCIWTGTYQDLLKFIDHLNSCDPTIKFTFEASQLSINFLDTTVKIIDNRIITDLYTKPTDSHNFLLFTSAHPKKCKQSIPFSQYLRIRRICSRLDDFDKHMKELTLHFLNREYPLDLLQEAAIKARRLDREALLNPPPKESDSEDSLILTTTFHPHTDCLRNIVKHNWDVLGKANTTLTLHQNKLLVAYKRPPNLSSFLVRADCRLKPPKKAKTHLLTQGAIGTPVRPASKQTSILQFMVPVTTPSFTTASLTNLATSSVNPLQRVSSESRISPKRKKFCTNFKCTICPLIIKTDSFTCTVTGQTFPCKFNITCKSSNLIYLITCKLCHKQYVGQTKNSIAQRFYSHLHNIRHNKKSDGVGLHFSSSDHNGVKDITIRVLDFIKVPPGSEKALTLRLKFEKYWIHKLRCPAPRGLNLFD